MKSMLQTAASLADDDNMHSEPLFKLNFKQISTSFKVAKLKEVNNLKEKKLTAKPITGKSTKRDVNTSTKTMVAGGSTYRYTTSTTTPSTTTPYTTPTRTTTSINLPMTTTTIISTTTASSSTINIALNLDLYTEDIRESIQKNLHQNPVASEDSFKKSLPSERNDIEKDSDLENLSEETIKSAKYNETSTITNEIKHHNPPSISHKSFTTTFSLPSSTNPTIENLNVLPSFDIADDPIDFLELKEDDKTGNSLFNELDHSNITLEDLIEHRVRGSSQLHLPTIVENSPRFNPDEKSELQDNMDIVTVIENLPHFSLFNLKNRKPYNIKTESEVNNYFDSSIDIENTDEV
ncbi:uncharacterized protein LOC135958671 [Calliphora vicina]|uniref:uncharacterized protein LOC135958671 n=1 Tax=Calliphora vicina TaxID=7373 RepID=UPI00325C2A31